MIDPENEIASNNEDQDNPRNVSNEQENFETIETDFSADDSTVAEDDQMKMVGKLLQTPQHHLSPWR
jgi:hypothetical protein